MGTESSAVAPRRALLRAALGLSPRPPVRIDPDARGVIFWVVLVLTLELASSAAASGFLVERALEVQPAVLGAFVGCLSLLMYLSYVLLTRGPRKRWRRALAGSLRTSR